ncbi:hypothetical protein OSB04_un001707 [Centaurea solstitialis]|uniref:GAG-pre-integrase domain-containing protein n=1 Tax=Centaurea solstitialis TaxID=347529 RepID=A0AA38SLD4_9ASTR|nr:hypothetical protein OSB04_un001707 [Centaurea solstitialis]
MSPISIPFYSPEESLRLIMGKWKLTGQNFPVWKLHLQNVLSAQGKLYVINKPMSRPKSKAPEEEFADSSMSPEFTGDLRDKFCHEVVKNVENQLGLYKHTGKLLIMQEIFSLKLKKGQSVKDHLIEIRRLFKCLSRLGYKMTQEELVYLMWFSLTKEVQDTASAYMKEPKKDVDKVHEDILASLEPVPEPADLMDTDIIDELGDLSCPECGSEDICEHSMNIDQIEIGLPDAPGIFMIDCLITSYESWVIDTGSGNHICNHLQGFTRRKTLRKDRSNLRVGEGTQLIAEAVGSYSLSLPSGLVLELDNCYYIPNMIKNVLSFDLLVDQGFYYKYDYKMFSVFKDNIFYFKATPVNGLYTVNLQDNSSEIYHISKRSKDIEDQTYLWHCRLGHINKKRVELLLKGGFLGTFNYKMKSQCPVSSQDQDKMKSVPYASAIGSIMYAMLCTRPDVAYSVSVTSRYQQNPGEPHWVAVNNILKYLRRTKEMFLVFGGSEDEISVTGYPDASFQTDRDDFRSQSGYIFTLNGGAISWKSSKQDTIADSTTEAEYIAASDAAKEAVWLRNFLSDLRVVASISRPIDIFCDNSGAVAQAKEPREHHKSRHVLVKYHLIREIIGEAM